MFKDNFESSKAILVCCRIISFVPKDIFSVSGYRHVALLILFYMKKKKNTENNLDMKRLLTMLPGLHTNSSQLATLSGKQNEIGQK